MTTAIIYPKDSVVIFQASDNGFIVNTKDGRGSQDDHLDGVFVFETLNALMNFIEKHYKKE